MGRLRAGLIRFRDLFHKERRERELAEELESHLQMHIEDNLRSGMTHEEARRQALIRLGGLEQVKEGCRDARGVRLIEEFFQDLRYGLRQLRRNPGFTIVAVLTLALGIGASTVIFGLFDAVFLRPLPVRHPERLVRVVQHVPKHGSSSLFYLDYIRALSNRATSFEFVFGQVGKYSHFMMSDPGPAADVTLRAVTPEFFQALGTPALYGRVLMPADATEESGTPPAVLSYKFWKQRFAGDPSVAKGGEIIVNGEHFAVVGVMPGGFGGLSLDTAPDLWIPLRAYPALWGGNAGTLGNLAFVGLNLTARLKSGAKVASAQAECRAIWKPVMRDFYTRNLPKLPPQVVTQLIRPKVWLEPLAHGVSVLRLRYGGVIKLLMASVGLLFLIVCANIAGLILARNTARQHEIAVRLAIGATHWRIARQMIAESVLLAATGAAGGLLIARAAMPLILTQIPRILGPTGWPVSITLNTPINMAVFLFLLLLAIVATLVFSLVPALANVTTPLDTVLRAPRSGSRLLGRQTLVAAQMALCVILLTAAGLLVRTFDDLAQTNPGFNASHVAAFTEDLTDQRVPPELLKTIRERVGEMPGVVSVAAAHFGVMRGHGMKGAYAPAGQQITSTDWLNTDINVVSPGDFRTMGMQILTGRDFVPGAEQPRRTSGPEKVIVNKAFVHEYLPNTDPIGKLIGQGVLGEVAHGSDHIIGVVNDAKDRSLREAMRPEVYVPLTRSILTHATFVLYIRTQVPAEAMIMPIRKALASIDAPLSVGLADTLREEVHNSISGDRETAVLASLFGLAAALLVCLGIYGLLAYSVTQRQQEIGIRMALGAEKRNVLWMVIRDGLKLVAIGVGVGIAGALAVTRFLSSLLYGIKPTDPLTFAAVSVTLVAVALLACYIPARRAAKVDPMVALRYE